jgi:hypothetical protein
VFGFFREPTLLKEGGVFTPPRPRDTYREVLRELSHKKINRIVENDTFDDSSAVYERFFLDCRSSIRIVARGIKREIFDHDHVIRAAQQFLAKDNTVLHLDLRAKNEADRLAMVGLDFFQAIEEMNRNRQKVIARFFREDPSKPFLGDRPSVSVGDDRMYRSRSFQPGGDYSTHANADVNFNDPAKVAKLIEYTDKALQSETVLA